MNKLYLILHKVRGEPAFDVAQRLPCPLCEGAKQGLDYGNDMLCDHEALWIIPTSGHRAYPFHWVPLTFVMKEASLGFPPVAIPADWPDHYTIHTDLQRHKPGRVRELMEKLRIGPKLRMRGF